MAFVCTLEPDASHVEIFQRGNAYLVIETVGYDDEEDKSYSLFVTLDIQPGGDWELSFCLIEYDGETGLEHQYWSGRDVARFINRDDRARIRSSLLRVIGHLLNVVQPPKVHMCTTDAYPPEKAVMKYFLIAHVFEMCGYAVHKADPYHGKEVWWMERTAPTTIENRPSERR